MEESRDDYYDVLERCSRNWHDARHDLLPWMNYFLAILHRAYREFEERAGQIKTPRGAKRALVEAAIEAWLGDFTLADLERTCPGVSRDTIRGLLREFRNSRRIQCLGRGPGARWRKKRNNLKRG